MTIPRIYCQDALWRGDICHLGKDDVRYIRSVIRMKTGDRLILFDGSGWEYEARIRKITAGDVIMEIMGKNKAFERPIRVKLMQGLPKADKMDFIVQKVTELGADEIIPFKSERTIPNLSKEKAASRISRWRQIAVEASRQSGRADVPLITALLSFEEVIDLPAEGAMKIIFWEEETQTSLKGLLNDERFRGIKDFVFIIGPEGGLSKKEVDKAANAGFIPVSLGKQVLKVETAAVTIMSVIQYEKGLFSGV